MSICNKAAIVGIGATEFSKRSGRSELRLALEAVTAALADAGISPADVRGLVTFTMDHNDEHAIARSLGLDEVTFFARTPVGGGGGCGTVALAALAVAGGLADVVVCYRAMNERSEERFGAPASSGYGGEGGMASSWDLDISWSQPYGMATPAGWIAMSARRYMHEYGATSEDFGRVAVAARKHAATNPAAWFYKKPISLEDHQGSRMIVDPLHLLDCCQESDGAVALVVTSLERAKDIRQTSAVITAAALGIGPAQVGVASHYRQDIGGAAETAVVAKQLWRQSDLTTDDIDLAILYDHFSPAVLMQLEALGFCKPGEGRHFIQNGAIEVGGRLPVNTNGGQLGEAYIHGFNGMAEAVRQLRGTAVNQVPGATHVVVSSGTHVPTSGLILTRA